MNFKNILLSKAGISLIIGFVLFGIVMFLAIGALKPGSENRRSESASPTPVSTIDKPVGNYQNILSLSPNEFTILKAGERKKITVSFKNPIAPNSINITLTKLQYTKEQNPTEVPINTTYNGNASTLTVSLQEPIQTFSQYVLTITDRENNKVLLRASYNSRDIQPTKPANNNQELKQYLPHETTSYKLSFNELRGVYVFNFKINPNSQISLSRQYEIAKKEAEDFIKNKGININSIVIEWRHS